MTDAKAFWDKAAENYAQSPIKDEAAYQFTLERTRSHLTPPDKVLELGCGTGSTALLLADDAGEITASDISPKMIEIAQRRAAAATCENVQFIAADMFDATLDRGPYDVVLALNLLHPVKDRAKVVQRISNLLRPGGLFISKTVCTPGRGAPLWLRLIRYALPVMQLIGKAPYVDFMDPAQWESTLTSQGLEILESGDHPPPSRYIVA
ncbi:MAG: class I SAM-dependent methyltransferase [Pseudomonadota bacterium]